MWQIQGFASIIFVDLWKESPMSMGLGIALTILTYSTIKRYIKCKI